MTFHHAVELDEELSNLWRNLQRLHTRLRDHTWRTYERVNPFAENLFDWKEKGSFVGGRDVTIYDSATVTGDVAIGDHTFIGPFCILDGTGGLAIGSYCSLAAGVHVQTHDTVKWALSAGKLPYEYAAVSIGSQVFVGANATITRGVQIGSRSVIAAGAVVTGDVEPETIVAGVPARRIGHVEVSADSVELRYERESG